MSEKGCDQPNRSKNVGGDDHMNLRSDAPRRYRIVLRGDCGTVFAGLFSDAAVESGDGYTCVVAAVRDDSEFYGLLDRFADLALRPVSIHELGSDGTAIAVGSHAPIPEIPESRGQ